MPGPDGLRLQQALHESGLEIPVIFVTGHGDIPSSVKAMKAGAVDFYPKPFNDEDMLRAIDEAIRRDDLNRTERLERDVTQRRFETLTPREREVMDLVVRGMLNKPIASALGASEKNIKIHRGRVMGKMKVQSVADLVRAAERPWAVSETGEEIPAWQLKSEEKAAISSLKRGLKTHHRWNSGSSCSWIKRMG